MKKFDNFQDQENFRKIFWSQKFIEFLGFKNFKNKEVFDSYQKFKNF